LQRRFLRKNGRQCCSRIRTDPRLLLPAVKDDFDSRFWEVDVTSFRVSHVCGFSARMCSMPMTEPDLRDLNASGLIAIGTTRDDTGGRWAVLAGADAIAAGERWWSSRGWSERADRAVNLLARHAGLAWLLALNPPPPLDESREPRRQQHWFQK
jgi:hypothetical protein